MLLQSQIGEYKALSKIYIIRSNIYDKRVNMKIMRACFLPNSGRSDGVNCNFRLIHTFLLIFALGAGIVVSGISFYSTAFATENIAFATENALTAENTNTQGNVSVSEDRVKPVKIFIRESSSVNTEKIFLGDIADINAPNLIKQRLNGISLGFAPRPGHFRVFNGKYLKSRIESDRLGSRSVAVFVPDKVYIKRKDRVIPHKKLKKIFTNYISQRIAPDKFKIRNFSIRGLGVYPDGNLSLTVCDNNNNIKGRTTVYVRVRAGGRNYGRISLSGWVDVFDTAFCASRNLERGTILSLNDVHREKVNISKISGDYFTDSGEILGKVLKTGLARGRCITSDMVKNPALVHRGDLVKMIAASGPLKIVTSGIAKSDGRLNDQIRVENIRSGKIVYAVVKGKLIVDTLN